MRLAFSLSNYCPSILTLTPRPPNKRPVPEKVHPPGPRSTSDPHLASLSISHRRGPQSLGRDHSQHQCCLPPAFVFFTSPSAKRWRRTRWRSFCLLPRRRGRSSTPSMWTAWPPVGRQVHPGSIGSQPNQICQFLPPSSALSMDFSKKSIWNSNRFVSLPFACASGRKFIHPFWHLPSRFRVLPQN